MDLIDSTTKDDKALFQAKVASIMIDSLHASMQGNAARGKVTTEPTRVGQTADLQLGQLQVVISCSAVCSAVSNICIHYLMILYYHSYPENRCLLDVNAKKIKCGLAFTFARTRQKATRPLLSLARDAKRLRCTRVSLFLVVK